MQLLLVVAWYKLGSTTAQQVMHNKENVLGSIYRVLYRFK
jgi:hypothetical protein